MSSEITFVDGSGDTTIKWEERSKSEMLAAIRDLMAKGHGFFVAEYDNGGSSLRQIENIDELTSRSVIVKDDTLRALYANGSLRVVHSFSSVAGSMLRKISPLLSPEEVVTMAATPRRENRRVIALPQYGGG